MQLPAVVGQPDPGEPPMTQQVRRIDIRIGNVAATQYKGRAARRAISRVRTLGIERARIAFSAGESQPVFHDAMAEAVEHGLITQEELDDLTATNIILRGTNHRHAVIETSLGPDEDDLERAQRRARILARTTGKRTIPVVAAPELPDELRQQADSLGLAVLEIPT